MILQKIKLYTNYQNFKKTGINFDLIKINLNNFNKKFNFISDIAIKKEIKFTIENFINMELKKTKKADLQGKRVIFFEIGFLLSLALSLLAFEWTSETKTSEGYAQNNQTEIEQESVPITRQEKQKEPPPPPPKTTEIINIVDNDVDIEDELVLEETEADEDTRVDIDAFAQEEEEEKNEQIFISVEEMPTFNGEGINAFRNYIQKNLIYPEVARENGIEGTIYTRFIVNKMGEVEKISILRGVDPVLDKAVVEAIQKSPSWEPGKQRGQAVNVSFTMPVIFTMD
jgi:protein TonB